MNKTNEVAVLCSTLRDLGCAVIVFIPEELNGANPEQVEDLLIEKGWDVIDSLMPIEDEEDDDKIS